MPALRLAIALPAVVLFPLVVLLAAAAPAVAAMPTPTENFAGIGATTPSLVTYDPPQPSGAVGTTQYVEAVAAGYEVFNKDGTAAQAARPLTSLWTGYSNADGNDCTIQSDAGWPVVRYDRLANRWLIAVQHLPNTATAGGPSFECVAVSKTDDATGGYWLYDFKYNDAGFVGGASIGVWPDAYYITQTPVYSTTTISETFSECAWNRSEMLAGQPAQQQCWTQTPATGASLVPADLEGTTAPPAGSPEYLLGLIASSAGIDHIAVRELHVDWSNPSNSTLTSEPAVPINTVASACATTGSCIAEPGTSFTLNPGSLDSAEYRNFGDHQSLLWDLDVSTGSSGVGVAWYELRIPGPTSLALYQQGTYGENGTYRFLGAIAQDHVGDTALGFSLSSSTIFPSIAITGRLPGDPTGALTEGEEVTQSGTGSELYESGWPTYARWGNRSSMSVDPSDDCTFWYLNEWVPTTGTFHWQTQIAAFKFNGCPDDFSLGVDRTTLSVGQGGNGTATISTTLTKGSAESISLSASGLPAGATASFQPNSVTTGQSSTVTLSAGAGTPPGTYPVTLTGTSAGATESATITFTVTAVPRTLMVVKSSAGSGAVASDPAGIFCGPTCSYQFAGGTTVTLTASADQGSLFLGWTGSGCAGTGTCQLYMDSDKLVSANFDRSPSCTDLNGLGTPFQTALAITLACSDPDSADTLGYSIVSGPSHGTLSVIDQTGHLTYTPDAGFSGPDSFTFKGTDNHGVDSSTATVSITVGSAPAPACSDLALAVEQDTAKTVTLACSHADPSETLTWKILSGPSHGSLGAIDPSGQVTYTPAPGYAGPDGFTYQATGSGGSSHPATVTITVSGRPIAAPNLVSLDLGDEVLGLPSPAQSVTLTNTGTAPLLLTSASIQGGSAADFSEALDACSGQTIQPGHSCSVFMEFRPSYLGSRASTLVFSDNAADSPQVVDLSGTGVASAPGQDYAVQSVAVNPNDTTTIVLIPTTGGTATLTLTIPTASVATTSRRCKRGRLLIKRKCRPATITVGSVHATGRAGVPLTLAITPTGKVKAALRSGRVLHAVATIIYKPANGSRPTVSRRNITLKGN